LKDPEQDGAPAVWLSSKLWETKGNRNTELDIHEHATATACYVVEVESTHGILRKRHCFAVLLASLSREREYSMWTASSVNIIKN
jgi:hypothetical protein